MAVVYNLKQKREANIKDLNISFAGIPRSQVGWLVGCFGFNCPLRQYFSLYRAVSQRKGEEKRKDR